MGTIADKLQGIIDAKNNLSAALVSAGIDVPIDFREYGNALVSAISSDIEYKCNMAGMIQAQNLTGSITPENMRLTHVPDFVANEITIIRGYAFDGCRYLSVANFPNVLTAWGSAFNNCISLISANLSSCKSVEAGAFRSCSAMTDCYLPAATIIQTNAFASCTSLSSLNVDSCTRLTTPFGNTAATSITLPNLTELHLPGSPRIEANTFGSAADKQRTAIMDLYLPNRTKAEVLNFSNYATWYLDPNCRIHASDVTFYYGSQENTI